MDLYRMTAEKIVNLYDHDWKEQVKLKEACICSVEIVVASALHLIILFTLAVISGLVFEVLLYFVTFGLLRFYAGGIHAKSFAQCITIYCILMFSEICGIKYYLLEQTIPFVVVFFLSLYLAEVIHDRFAARQMYLEDDEPRSRRRATLILRIIMSEMGLLFCVCIASKSMLLREILYIQAFALMTQSICLFFNRNQCQKLSQGGA